MNEIQSIDTILQNRWQDFEKRLVPNFLEELGYTEIVPEPKFGTGRVDYLVRHNGESFYVESISPSLDEGGLFDPSTMAYIQRLEELISRKFDRELPEVFQDCFLEGDYDGLLRQEVPDLYITQSIIEKILPWRNRITELPRFTSEASSAYRSYEQFPKEFLDKYYGFSIPYPFGSLTLTHTENNKKRWEWTLRWRLLRQHKKYGPRYRRCLFGGAGGNPASYNLAKGINIKAKMYREWIRTEPKLKNYPVVFFMDGRPFLRMSGSYDFSDLDIAFSHEVEWRGDIPSAVVIIGTWGVPRGVPMDQLERLSEHSADMVFYPYPERDSRKYPVCLNPFLKIREMVRHWSVQRHLVPVG